MVTILATGIFPKDRKRNSMIIVSGGVRGGSGKTIIATNLAVIRANKGKVVLLVDGGEQEMATQFTSIRESQRGDAGYAGIKFTGSALDEEIRNLKRGYDDIVIDVGGRNTTGLRAALAIADVFLVPFIPGSDDLATMKATSNLVGDVREVNPRLRVYAFTNMANLNRIGETGKRNYNIGTALRKSEQLTFVNTSIGNRHAFMNAALLGASVVEMEPKNPEATKEIMTLYRVAFQGKAQSALIQ